MCCGLHFVTGEIFQDNFICTSKTEMRVSLIWGIILTLMLQIYNTYSHRELGPENVQSSVSIFFTTITNRKYKTTLMLSKK